MACQGVSRVLCCRFGVTSSNSCRPFVSIDRHFTDPHEASSARLWQPFLGAWQAEQSTKVSRGNSEYQIIRNGSGIDLGYYKTTDRLDILFHHKVAAGVGFIINTSFAAGRSPSQPSYKMLTRPATPPE